MEFLRAGFDLLCSDLDVVWLRDPRPYLKGRSYPSAYQPICLSSSFFSSLPLILSATHAPPPNSCPLATRLTGTAGTTLLPAADVVVSTDVTHGGADTDRDAWGSECQPLRMATRTLWGSILRGTAP